MAKRYEIIKNYEKSFYYYDLCNNLKNIEDETYYHCQTLPIVDLSGSSNLSILDSKCC